MLKCAFRNDLPPIRLLVPCLCAIFAPFAWSQEQSLKERFPWKDPAPRRAELPVTEEDSDPDVAKRPRFRRALDDAKVYFYFGAVGTRLPSEVLMREEIVRAHEVMKKVFNPQFTPNSIDDGIQWFGTQIYRNALSPSQRVKSLGGSWKTLLGEAEVGQRLDINAEHLWFRLRVEGRQLVEIGPPPSKPTTWEERQKEPCRGLDPREATSLLEKILSCSFADSGYGWFGGVGELEGVAFFRGEVRYDPSKSEGADHPEPQPWCRSVRILITDSDPQYICLNFETVESP